MSKGEDQLIQIFRRARCKFEREKTYPDLEGRNHVPLRFDFFLPSLGVLCEVDGSQHFQQIGVFGGRKGYLAAAERDRRKNSYCLAHNIPLYRIPYWELPSIKTLDDILTESHRVRSKFHNDYLVPPK